MKATQAANVDQTADGADSAVSDEDADKVYERLDAAMIKQMEVIC